MKKIGYWFAAYGMVLLGISFLSSFLTIQKERGIQTSVKAKEYNEVKFISGGITGTAAEAEALLAIPASATVPEETPPSKANDNKEVAEKKSKKNTSQKSKSKKTTKKEAKKNKNIKGKKTKYMSPISGQSLKSSELAVLERIVQAEAGGEDEIGRILVANVILNRVKKKKFPSTIRGVVFAYADGYYQFSPIMDGRYYSVKVSSGTKKAVKKALSGVDYSDGALYFMNRRTASSKNARWFDSRLTFVLKHGSHEFFR